MTLSMTPVEPPVEPPVEAADDRWARAVRFIILAATIWTFVIIPVMVVGAGWRPADDALRHVGEAISGRPWSDVLVLQPGLVDPNPGWNAFLGLVHRFIIHSPFGLLTFSSIALATLVLIAPLAGFRRPEAWVAALLLGAITDTVFPIHLVFGRPFLISMAVLLFLASLWKRLDAERRPTGLLAVLAVLLVLANWMHGNGYLWLLPLGAFVLSGELRVARRFGFCVAVGMVGGALLTGHPFAFLLQTFAHPFLALMSGAPTRVLVNEFQPSSGSPIFLALVGLVVVALGNRASTGIGPRDPLLWLAIGGWVLGLSTLRFWSDWGVPVTLLLVARVIEGWLEREWPAPTTTRVLAALVACVALTFAMSADREGRWSGTGWMRYQSLFSAKNQAWLPDAGGVLYNTQMGVFYEGFYLNPWAPYRYVLGFEPTMMPSADLKAFRAIQLTHESDESLRPWVEQLRPQDRIQLSRSTAPSGFPQVEWFSPEPGVLLGRLKR